MTSAGDGGLDLRVLRTPLAVARLAPGEALPAWAAPDA
ncbi:MAG: hypothetical protein QOC64_1703, partial [Solirubrobacteraceae bacterium]|nr:hypothetical protein [Solirubrobacteraceae bacterium]